MNTFESSLAENTTRPTVLAVDDDPASLGILTEYLQRSGFRVIVARDGESALEKARHGKPNLILLDLLMPKMDGFETCRRLKADEISCDIPVIFLTAMTGLADKVEAFWTGGVDYITKPFQQVEVLARVKTHLALYELQKQLAAQNAQLKQEIEEHRRADEALLEERNLFIGGPTIIFKWKSAEKWPVEYVSPNVWSQYGYKPEDFMSGKILYETIVHPDDLPRFVADVKAYCEAKKPCFEREYRIARADGEYRWLFDFTVVVRDSIGVVTHFHGYVQDITERKRAKEAVQKAYEELERRVDERTAELKSANERLKVEVTERKRTEEALQKAHDDLENRVRERTAQIEASKKDMEDFHYSISHDLRAPLRSISGFSQIVLDEAGSRLDEASRKNIERIRLAANRMAKLLDDLQNLSRLTRREMRLESVNLSQLAKEAVKEIRKGDPSRPVEFIIAEGLIVQGDPGLLQVALQNLLDNAWKFTNKHPTARIEFGAMARSESALRFPQFQKGRQVFFVRDDGAGFHMKESANRLFHPFRRLHTDEEFEGTGMGLAIIQRIVQRHGGEIWVESEVEKGTTFYFSL